MNAQDLRNYVAKSVGFGVETPGAVADNATTETRNTQQDIDREILDNVPYDLPLNDIEQGALDREMQRERNQND